VCYTKLVQDLIQKAATLQEALPYIRRFHGDVFVIKYGGHAMVDPDLRDSFARDVVLMKYVGLHPVVVHGGGPQIDEMLKSLGVASERLDGLRVTDDHTMEVVEMVLGGKINQQIVSLIAGHGGRAVGLTGKDDSFLRGTKIDKMKTKGGRWVDPGRVGNVTQVNPDVLRRLVDDGFIPVIAPIAVDADGKSLNVNADTVAGKVAEALQARKFVLLTDIEGVRGKNGKVVSSLSASEIDALKRIGRGGPQGAHHRWPCASRGAARDLHRPGDRHRDHALSPPDQGRRHWPIVVCPRLPKKAHHDQAG
jgi:acetylglutamate kinase